MNGHSRTRGPLICRSRPHRVAGRRLGLVVVRPAGFIVTRPRHVTVNELLVRPTEQA